MAAIDTVAQAALDSSVDIKNLVKKGGRMEDVKLQTLIRDNFEFSHKVQLYSVKFQPFFGELIPKKH